MRTAVFAGSFDPITLGHVDVIRRGLRLFSRVVVGIGHNPKKARLIGIDERVALCREACAELGDVVVEPYEGLTVQFATRIGAQAILRGLRDTADFAFEAPQAHANRQLAPHLETVFVLTDPGLAYVSSSLMREIVAAGGDARAWLPPGSEAALRRALGR